MLVELPQVIQAELLALIRKMDWPRAAFKYFEIRRPGKATLFTARENLNIGMIEQLTEQYRRLGQAAIARFKGNGSRRTAKLAAEYIMRATDLRCMYQDRMTGEPDAKDFPFPILTHDEADDINKQNSD